MKEQGESAEKSHYMVIDFAPYSGFEFQLVPGALDAVDSQYGA